MDFVYEVLQPHWSVLKALHHLGAKLANAKVRTFGKQRWRKATIVLSENEVTVYGRALARVCLLGKPSA